VAAVLLSAGVLTAGVAGPGLADSSPSADPSAPSSPAGENVKYYRIGPDGAQSLTQVAESFLGGSDRAPEIFSLNVGRPQPDGKVLSTVDHLRCGWLLVMPWDAVGPGVRYGPLPANSAADGAGCAAKKAVRSPAPDWSRSVLSLAVPWRAGRGAGVLVAMLSTGVNAASPRLTGRVQSGADVVGGGRGDSDPSGVGTAMAVVAAASGTGGPAGVAPKASILPVRGISSEKAAPVQVASAIDIAVSAGARVIAVGPVADLAEPTVAAAIRNAVAHDAVVIAPALAGNRAEDAASSSHSAGVLLIQPSGTDGKADGRVRPDADVLAPGPAVLAPLVAASGSDQLRTGPEVAVAYAAGTAALLRSAQPALDAEGVARRLIDTATERRKGPGMIDPAAAVAGSAMPALAAHPAPAGRSGLPLVLWSAVLLGCALAIGLLSLFAVRRPRSPAAPATARVSASQPGPVVEVVTPVGELFEPRSLRGSESPAGVPTEPDRPAGESGEPEIVPVRGTS